jgi:ABC-2 type transport system permease protein
MTSLRTFGAVLWRDIFVTGRELPSFVAQVLIQLFFMLFVFAKVPR